MIEFFLIFAIGLCLGKVISLLIKYIRIKRFIKMIESCKDEIIDDSDLDDNSKKILIKRYDEMLKELKEFDK